MNDEGQTQLMMAQENSYIEVVQFFGRLAKVATVLLCLFSSINIFFGFRPSRAPHVPTQRLEPLFQSLFCPQADSCC